MLLMMCVGLVTGTAFGASGADDTAFDVGMCTHFCQHKGVVELNIQSIQHAGIRSIRDEVGWSRVESTKGKLEMPAHFDEYVRYAAQQGIDVLLILDYGNPFYDDGNRPTSPEAVEGFCRYAEYVVEHFGDAVRQYEIWNEWDIPIGLPERHRKKDGEPNRGSADDYFNLLKVVYPRIKAVDPGVTVMGGCPTPGAVGNGWLERIIELGAIDCSDAISIHTYNYGRKGSDRTPEAWQKWMHEVQAMLRQYNDGADPDFYVTEMGWPTHVGERGTDPELSGSYLGRLYLLARTMPSFRGLWWYDFQDDGWSAEYNENNFGIVRPDLTPKPAYHVMTGLSSLIRTGEYLGRVNTEDDQLWGLRFQHDGEEAWAVWSGDDQERQVLLTFPQKVEALTLQELGHQPMDRSIGHREWAEGRDTTMDSDTLSLVVDHRPWLLRGELEGASITAVHPRTR